MSTEALGQFAAGVAQWRALMSAVGNDAGRWEVFTGACAELAEYTTKGLPRVAAVDELQDIATAHGLAAKDPDTVQQVIADAFAHVERPPLELPVLDEPPKGNGHDTEPAGQILSKAGFMARLKTPDYLIDGLLQRRFVYALTGQTGHAKTAVALLIAQLVSCQDRNAMLGTHHVEKGRVIYFVGENPDDVGYRILASDARRRAANTETHHDDPNADNIWFCPGVFNIAQMIGALRADCERNGEAALIIVDTSAAYFPGNEEMSNTQMGAYARLLRQLTTLPGGPCVLVLCHPIKHVQEPSQLLPRGGGAYLAEMDGNLTLWRLADDVVELAYSKIRGPGFQAMSFKLEPVTAAKLTDKRGRPIPSIRAVAITDTEEEERLDRDEQDEDRVLAAMLSQPADEGGSFATWARTIGWVSQDGEPYKKKVERIITRLGSAKKKYTVKNRNRWFLTEAGKDAARKAALRFEAERERGKQASLL